MDIKLVEHLMESVYSKAHSNPLFIWWYDVSSEELECFPRSEVDLHTCEKFLLPKKINAGALIKGRIYDDAGKPKLMIYTAPSRDINQQVLQKIVSKLQSVTNLDFSEISNESGEELILEKKV
jgi:hypothetical protein